MESSLQGWAGPGASGCPTPQSSLVNGAGMGSREVQSSTWAPPRGVFSQSTRWPGHCRPGASSATVGAIHCPRDITGNPCNSTLTPTMMPPAPAMLSNTTGHQGHLVRDLDVLEASGITRQQATSPETLPSHQNFIWPRGTATRNALPRCIAPLDLYCPSGHTGALSLPGPRCLPLCEKLGVGGSELQARARVCPSPSQSPFEGAGNTGDHPTCWLQ